MYYILENELKKKKITRKKLADILGIGTTTISAKLNLKSDFTFPECVKIKQEIGYEGSIEELFKTD